MKTSGNMKAGRPRKRRIIRSTYSIIWLIFSAAGVLAASIEAVTR